MAARWTNDPGKTRFEPSAVQVREDGGIPVRLPETEASLESLFPLALEGLEVGLEELIEEAGPRVAGPVNGRADAGLRQHSGGHGQAAHAE
jgi:hypothetical protein